MSNLAINGGKPIKEKQNPIRLLKNTFDENEKKYINDVLERGVLSDFIAGYNEYFEGGYYVKKFEEAFAEKMGVKYAVSFNSATSALHASLFACDIGIGDEVITSPWSMSATASSILMQNAIPVFADITYENYCNDTKSIRKNIISKSDKYKNGTKAILTVDLFGGTPKLDELRKLADDNKIYLIEDNAQAPLAKWKGKFAGTYGDIGVFSLNCHKVINSGEGGVLITNNEELAFKAKLIRNHAEVVIEQINDKNYEFPNMLGYNYRMTELQAAVALAQTEKLEKLIEERRQNSEILTKKLLNLDIGILPYIPDKDSVYSYYSYPVIFDNKKWNINRNILAKAVNEEGYMELSGNYVKPIYLMNMYQKKCVYANSEFPFTEPYFRKEISYREGICPVVEDLYNNKVMNIYNLNRHGVTEKYIDGFIEALLKVYKYQKELI